MLKTSGEVWGLLKGIKFHNVFKEMMQIAVAFDQNYLNQFYALVTSILVNNRKHKIHFHLISSGIDSEKNNKLSGYIKSFNGAVTFYNIDHTIVNKLGQQGDWSEAVYYRLYFPLIIPSNIEKLLYLDSDTVVVNDLFDIFDMDLNGCPLGAVYDNFVKSQPRIGIHKEGSILILEFC